MMTFDPRPDFTRTATWVGTLVDGVRPDQLDAPTPCDDWTVRELLGHLVAVLGRLASIGQGADFSETSGMVTGVPDAEWSNRFAAGLRGMEQVWSSDEVLSADVRAPFGTMPGAKVLGGYIMEYLAHGWDLARATGQDPEAPAGLAEQTLAMAQVIVPADRGAEFPFGPPVEPRSDALPTERLANWLGRAA